MKKFTFLILIIISIANIPLFSKDYEKVDRIVQNYPNSFSDPDQLAKLINRDFKLPEEKARAIFTWIALNIDYDIKALNSKPEIISFSYSTQEEKLFREQKIEEDLAIQTLRKGKAVCQGYSTLYKYLCDLASIECVIVPGTSKTRKTDIGKLPRNNDHTWNAVKINNEWKLIDVTWGAGYTNENATRFIPAFNDYYFFTSPYKFFLNHYPEDSAWLLIDISKETFANLPLYYSSFYKLNVEVVEPQKGIILISKNESIKLVLKNSKNELVSMKFENDKYSKLVQPKNENEFSFYEIRYEKNANTYLTVYINTRSFVTFKVERH